MRPPGSAAELEARRRRAAEYFQERKPLRKIASLLGVSLTSVKRWKRTWKAEGSGRFGCDTASRPCAETFRETSTVARQDSCQRSACGWISHRFVDVRPGGAGRTQDVRCLVPPRPCASHLARSGVLSPETAPRGTGARCQIRRAVAQEGLASHQKKARRRGASIVFIDESGFRLQPVNRRTWVPRGETPVQRAWDRYDRLSVIDAVSLSPTRRRIGTPLPDP